MMAKRAAGLYYSGKRTREWLKFKAMNEQARARTNRGMRGDRARRLAWGPDRVPQSSPGARHVLPQGKPVNQFRAAWYVRQPL